MNVETLTKKLFKRNTHPLAHTMNVETLSEARTSILMELYYALGGDAFYDDHHGLGVYRYHRYERETFRVFWGYSEGYWTPVGRDDFKALVRNGWISKLRLRRRGGAPFRLSDKALSYCAARATDAGMGDCASRARFNKAVTAINAKRRLAELAQEK